jgi:predicted DsbA family dithiol-disulfide isomerase
VTAVPTFVFESTWAVPGAQDADTMLRVLRTVAERITPAPPPAGVCDDDACAV